MKVAILGATGETGSSIVEGLLESRSTHYEIKALVRSASLGKEKVIALEARGVEITPVDLNGPRSDLVSALQGSDVVIAAIDAFALEAQISLVDAAKVAGVKRFVPCFFATIAPPSGILDLRDRKQMVLNHIQKIYLPYTVIDVGWWHQLALPRVPSGRFDYGLMMPVEVIAGDGNVPSALTDLHDIGKYVARIIADPRTLNRKVFAYSGVYTQNQIYDLVEKMTGEVIQRHYISNESIEKTLSQSSDLDAISVMKYQYMLSWGIRGDNQPAYAEYLGYLLSTDLYPDLLRGTLEDYCRTLLDNTAVRPYSGREF